MEILTTSLIYKTENFKLTDIVELTILQNLQDAFAKAFDMPSVIYDLTGNAITKPSCVTEFCCYVNTTVEGRKNCLFHHTTEKKSPPANSFPKKDCALSNLTAVNSAIRINNQHIANFCIAPILVGEIDEDEIVQYAQTIGLNEQTLLQKAQTLKKNNQSQLKKATDFLKVLIEQISELGNKNLANKTVLEHYRLLAENSTDVVWLMDLDFNMNYLSPATEKLFGYTLEERKQLEFKQLYSPQTISYLKKMLAEKQAEYYRTGQNSPQLFELEGIHKDGHVIYFEVSTKFVLDNAGKIIGIQGSSRDITQRKKELQLLNDNQERYEKMVENMPNGVAIYQPINNARDFKFITVNKETEKITNSTREELIGHTLLERFPNMDKTPLFGHFQKIAKDGKNIYVPPFFYKDGQRQGWRENYIYKLKTGEIVAIFKDVTDLKQQEVFIKNQNIELRKAKEKAEESAKLKTAFLNNISHEFRTPLNGILGFSELMLKANRSDEQRQKYADYLKQSCDRLLEVVTDTIEISEVQNKSVKIIKNEYLLTAIVREVIEQVMPKIKQKDLDFTFINCDAQNHLKLITDKNKLSKSIKHLLDNAVKFTSKGCVELSCQKINDRVEISVSDTGIGISPEKQEVIFEPFRQVELELSRNFGGNGIGLSLVKSYIEMLGGTIGLQSELNKGTTVKIILPIK